MSELKATSSGEIRARNALLGYWWYEQSEVDKVIAEKDAEIAKLNDKLRHYPMMVTLLENDKKEIAEKDKELLYQKYKRCMAMAKWCECKRIDAADDRIPKKKWDFYGKWHKCWLIIAEKFKEAK